MCGIAGILLTSDAAPSDLGVRLEAMARAMRHRGPDGEGILVSPDGRAGLANRRLAIRDLSAFGHMPMSNGDATVWITYNGEVYNADALRLELERRGHRFRSSGDTEVLLHGYESWGVGVLDRLQGMFAFGILDLRPGSSAPRLFLARDRLGIKPLYYAQTGQAFVFASELTALLASGLIGRDVSPAGLAGYLLTGSVPAPFTFYADAAALEPARYLTVDAARTSPIRPVPYRRLPDAAAGPISHEEAVAQVRAGLAESVRARLVSDVPLGAFLSGGLDSSSIVALMRQSTAAPIHTCSVVFEEEDCSEAPYARAMAAAAGAEHHERVITAQDFASELDAILAALDQPSVDGANTYLAAQTARQAGLGVALSGLGGDELFAGYPNTFEGGLRLLRALCWIHGIPGAATLSRAALRVGIWPDRWRKLRDALGRPASAASAYVVRRGLFAPAEVRALLPAELWEAGARDFDPVRHVAERADAAAEGSPKQQIRRHVAWTSRAELRTFMPDQLLRDTDVMSLAHSLEVRVPFLDHRLVELVLTLPDALKRGGAQPKPLLHAALYDQLPPDIRDRRHKQPFTLPFQRWMQGPLRQRVESLLWEAQTTHHLNPGPLRRTWSSFLAGKAHWTRVWALAVLGGHAQRFARKPCDHA